MTSQLPPTENLTRFINQNGVTFGPRKLGLIQKALNLRGAPPLYSQEKKGDETMVYVKIFDPCGSWEWFITEWDGNDTAFGLVNGCEQELGYISIFELATTAGPTGIGLEIDVWFKPTTLGEVKKGLTN